MPEVNLGVPGVILSAVGAALIALSHPRRRVRKGYEHPAQKNSLIAEWWNDWQERHHDHLMDDMWILTPGIERGLQVLGWMMFIAGSVALLANHLR